MNGHKNLDGRDSLRGLDDWITREGPVELDSPSAVEECPCTDAEIARSQDRIAAVLGPEEVKILNLEAELVQLKLERFRLRKLLAAGLGIAEGTGVLDGRPFARRFIENAKKELGL